jgi:glycosyltransferase involved in cell wall biosynthesis
MTTTPTLHILTNPSAITHPRYRMDPFNVAALKFIKNMKKRGWNMIHYGHESAEVECENVVCITNEQLPPPENGDLFLHKHDLIELYNQKAIEQVELRKSPGDMILCFYGAANQATCNAHPDLKIVEPSIGYPPDTVFSPYRAFVSYSQMHYYYGIHGKLLSPSWFDAVIPNAFTPEEFEFSAEKDDYFVYLGRVNFDKGIDLCVQVTKQLGKKLVIAGPATDLRHLGYDEVPEHVTMVGYVGPEERSKLLSRAQCLMAPTHYIEPFGNIVAEAQFCGTPVIATDWGGFVDSVVHGVTGYRCKDFSSFVEAAKVVHELDPSVCRQWAEQNFSDIVVHDKFDAWLKKIHVNDFYA